MIAFHTITDPIDRIILSEQNVTTYIDSKYDGIGSLYICESCIIWKKNDGSELGLNIGYPDISVHAISSTKCEAFPQQCIYLLLENTKPEANEIIQDEQSGVSRVDNEESFDPAKVLSCEMYLCPYDKERLMPIFRAIAKGQSLNADTDNLDQSDSYREDDFEDDIEYDNPAKYGRFDDAD
ncbi:hypothetical protein GJ496_001042 [Pomphorhynchus laevis]|nr:hypothetical protein GJ496_001042 [Pomphorhynchus laevis]